MHEAKQGEENVINDGTYDLTTLDFRRFVLSCFGLVWFVSSWAGANRSGTGIINLACS